MRKILCAVVLAIAILTTTFTQSALAADTAPGAKVFNVNCAACHK